MTKLKTQLLTLTMCLIPAGTRHMPQTKIAQKNYFSKVINYQPSTDIFKKEKVYTDIKSEIEAIIAKEKTLKTKTTELLKKNFDTEDTEFLMYKAPTAEQQIYLAEQVAQNAKRKEEKLSAYAIGNLMNTKIEDKNIILKLINSKQHNGNFYPEDAVMDITFQITHGESQYETEKLTEHMLKIGYPAGGFSDILFKAKDFDARTAIFKHTLAKKLVGQKDPKGQFLPAETIIKKLNSIQLPQ